MDDEFIYTHSSDYSGVDFVNQNIFCLLCMKVLLAIFCCPE